MCQYIYCTMKIFTAAASLRQISLKKIVIIYTFNVFNVTLQDLHFRKYVHVLIHMPRTEFWTMSTLKKSEN